MRRPVIDIMLDRGGLTFITICLPPNIWEKDTMKEEIPEVIVYPYKTHVQVSVASVHGAPRIRYKPVTTLFTQLEDIPLVGKWLFDFFWEGIENMVNNNE